MVLNAALEDRRTYQAQAVRAQNQLVLLLFSEERLSPLCATESALMAIGHEASKKVTLCFPAPDWSTMGSFCLLAGSVAPHFVNSSMRVRSRRSRAARYSAYHIQSRSRYSLVGLRAGAPPIQEENFPILFQRRSTTGRSSQHGFHLGSTGEKPRYRSEDRQLSALEHKGALRKPL